MKLDGFPEVRKKIVEAVVPRIGVVLVRDTLLGQLLVEGGSAFLEPIVIVLATVEVNVQGLEGRSMLAC
jgi:hypothetical protein